MNDLLITGDSSQISSIKKVECDVSPFFYAFYQHHPCRIVVDTGGATSSIISRSFLHSAVITPLNTFHSWMSSSPSSSSLSPHTNSSKSSSSSSSSSLSISVSSLLLRQLVAIFLLITYFFHSPFLSDTH